MPKGHPGQLLWLYPTFIRLSPLFKDLNDPFCHVWYGNGSPDKRKSLKVLLSIVILAEIVCSKQMWGTLEGKRFHYFLCPACHMPSAGTLGLGAPCCFWQGHTLVHWATQELAQPSECENETGSLLPFIWLMCKFLHHVIPCGEAVGIS